MIEDCSKKEKQALRGVILFMSIILIIMFKDYINMTLGIMYIVFVGIYAMRGVLPYVYCLMNNTQKFKRK